MRNRLRSLVLVAAATALSATESWARCADNPGAGVFIDAVRDSLETTCPCAAAATRAQHALCSKGVLITAVLDGSLPRQCRSVVNKAIRKSTCGRPGSVTCCAPGPTSERSCRLRPSAATCVAPATLGSTSSCYDACGPACGNGITEAGEECDDRNLADGDGCSSTCHLEVSSSCVAVSAGDYVAAYGSDPTFQDMLRRAQSLGYATTPIAPVRCITDDAATVFTAALPRVDGPETLTIESRSGVPEALGTVLHRASGSTYEILVVAGTIRYDLTDPTNPTVEVLDLNGQPVDAAASPSPPFPSCAQHLDEILRCITSSWRSQLASDDCHECAVCRGNCISFAGFPTSVPCQAGCAKSAACTSCYHDNPECQVGRTCQTSDCQLGYCEFPSRNCQANFPTSSVCKPCEYCLGGMCENGCGACQICQSGLCVTLNENRPLGPIVAGRLRTDAGTCVTVTGGCPSRGCGLHYIYAVDYRDCAGNWNFSADYRAVGIAGDGPPNTCVAPEYSLNACLAPECNLAGVRAQAIANAFSDGRHPPLPNPAATWIQPFIPADTLATCCAADPP